MLAACGAAPYGRHVNEKDMGAEAVASPGGGGTFGPFRYPVFRAIWTANLFSNLGSTIQSVAAAWFMTELTDSHRLIALVQASATIPIMLFGMFAGAIADTYNRRTVMLVAQVGMFLVSIGLAATTWAGVMTPLLLLAFTLAIGVGTALNSPAWQASVRSQVGLADLPQAIALNTISFNLARSVGPAIGGLLISLWNVALAFAVNAASFVAMIGVLLRWRPEHTPRPHVSILPSIAAGLRFCAGSSPIRRILLRGLALGFGVAGYQALIPSVVRDRLGGGEVGFGLILGLFGVGSILAALFIGPLRRRWGTEKVLGAGTLGFVVALVVLSVADTVWQAIPAAFVAGMAWVGALTSINVAVQMRSPDEVLGRCLSIYQAVTFGGMAIGSWAWGAVADWRGLPFALDAAAVFLAASLLLRFVAPMPAPSEGRIEPSPAEPEVP